MAPLTNLSSSFQPWTRDNQEEESLKDILARVSNERGHFRDISEATLQEEIAVEGALELSDSEEESEEEEDAVGLQKGKGKPETREELYKAKFDMLANVREAEQDILMSLDFISLLLSKDAPKQAQTTISPFLKDNVPTGSLGTDIWQRMPLDRAREGQDELLATKVRMETLHESADNLLAAASRLEDNVRRETQYWDQVLSISDKGWNVCRIPSQQHRLGVRFGFSESALEFSRRGIAALNPSSDGTIALERGIGSRPKALHAMLRKKGQIIGSSKLPDLPNPDESTLETRIRYARDSLYDEELYHEIIRESRTLMSVGVGMKGSAICLGSNAADLQVSLDLVSLDEGHIVHLDESNEDNGLAQAVVLAARLLLSQAHRDRLKKRSELPPPMSNVQKDDNPIMPILRPIMSIVMHRSVIDWVNAYLDNVSHILSAASMQNSHHHARLTLPRRINGGDAEAVVTAFMQPWISEAVLEIVRPEHETYKFSFKIETSLAYNFGPVILVTTPLQPAPLRIENLEDLHSVGDWQIASGLASTLVPELGQNWLFNEQEAHLIEDVGPGGENRNIWVSLDSDAKTLALSSKVREVSWSLGGENSQTSFWDAPQATLKTLE